MKNRTVSHLLYAEQFDMGGMPIRQPLPTMNVNQFDPFLLLHHGDIKVPTHLDPDHAGVGPHPHRGFSPVTFIFKGGVHHRDSRGNDSVIYEGGAQWMNAGMGVIHSERPPHDIHERGGRQEIIQLWINTPAAHKMDQPEYFPVSADEVPTKTFDEGRVLLRVYAGNLQGLKGPIPSHTEVTAATLTLKKDATFSTELPTNHHALIYLLDGQVNVDGYGLADGLHAVLFKNDGDGLSLRALADTRILLLSGKPIEEEVVSHGPFVMNNTTQILEAMRDYQMGKMGVLVES